MKRTSLRIFSLVLSFILLFSCVSPVLAYTVTEASLTSYTYGQNKTVFYVNTSNKKTAKIDYQCAAGAFEKSDERLSFRYGYWEIKIKGRNKTSESWKDISKKNIKNDFSDTIKLKGYTQYRIQIYAWNTATIGRTLGGKYNWSGAKWVSCPTITFKANSKNIINLARI